MTYDLAIIGAGAAGLSATRTARELGLDVVPLEASHRIGGRGYTEELAPGVALELGCHWMHSARLNPWVPLPDRRGFTSPNRSEQRRVRKAWDSTCIAQW